VNKKRIKQSLWILLSMFILMNMVAIFHSYQFTHFTNGKAERTKDPKELSMGQKIKILFLGVSNPRPENKTFPLNEYQTITLKSNKEIECWEMKVENAMGTILLFHGFSASKSSLLGQSDVFNELGYNTLLVDFMGSGGSEGNRTTVGFFEAEQVKACFDYVTKNGEENIYLFGTSMGAVAIMKAIHDYGMNPQGIIIECPFGSMYQTVCARFKMMNLPAFPMAGFLVFWGGLQNGFWGFSFNPIHYAKKITCPTLLLFGAKDEKVTQNEIDAIFKNLAGSKKRIIYPETGHDNYLFHNQNQWEQNIQQFLTTANHH